MQRIRFDRLRTVRLEGESQYGCAQLCREPDGARWIRLCIKAPACQRAVLSGLDERVPVRLEQNVLELLLPWYGGIPLRQWIYERTPTLGQRRDACLTLLEQLVDENLPPCLTALAARTENLTVEEGAVHLQYLPRFQHWQPGMGQRQAVCAAAAVICEILTPETGKRFRRPLPEELQLLYRRQHDYSSWGQLQRDVAAIPDELPRIKPAWVSLIRRVQSWLSRYEDYLLRLLAALLLTAALLSLFTAYRRWRSGNEGAWQGMPQVGDQDLRSGEGGE